MRYIIGCAGWGYQDWRGAFYAADADPSSFLRAYARVFRFVEVDSTFYTVPSRERVGTWARETPRDFTFSPKLPGAITHDAKLRSFADPLARFLDALEPLRRAGKLGPLVAQLPPSFRFDQDADALGAFVDAWPRDVAPLVVELRNRSWWREETYETLRRAGATLAWSVTSEGRAPTVRTSDIIYSRVIGDRALDDAPGGPSWDRVQRDGSAELARWVEAWKSAREEERVWIVANNHFEGHGPATARRIAEMLGAPPFDLALAAREPGQRGLADFG